MLYGLEILRFGAAFAVMVWHYQFFFFQSGPADQLPFQSVLIPFYGAGHYAVPWFWTLSGYIFFWNYEHSITKRKITATEFGWLRFSRLYPLHLLTLLLVVALQLAYSAMYGLPLHYGDLFNTKTFITHLFLGSNWFTTDYSFNGPVWSISVEVVVYAVFFVLARSAAISTTSKTGSAVLTFLAAYWVAARLLPSTSLVWILHCATCFFLGGLLVKCKHRLLVILSLTPVLIALIVVKPSYAWPIAAPAFGVMLFSSGAIWQHPLARHAAKLGRLTYASYLLHFPVALAIVLFVKLSNVPIEIAASHWFFSAYFVAVFTLSHFSFKYFERPAQIMIRRMTLKSS